MSECVVVHRGVTARIAARTRRRRSLVTEYGGPHLQLRQCMTWCPSFKHKSHPRVRKSQPRTQRLIEYVPGAQASGS